jgi:glycosyltransferase 2 family protein
VDHGALRTPLIRLARLAGIALSLACAAYVGWRWHALHAAGGGSPLAALDLRRVLAAAAVYTLCGVPLAAAWIAALRAAGEHTVPARAAALGYLQTQVAKYLPGGFLHYLSRHAHGRSHGAAHVPLAAASVIETLSLLLAASAVMLAGMPQLPAQYAWLDQLRWLPLAASAGAFALWLLLGRRTPLPAGRFAGALALCVLLHLGFFILSAAACGLLLAELPAALPWHQLTAAVAVAWLAGYVVIGAPGGLGVREAVLVAALSGPLGAETALALAVGYRLATVGGDIAMAALALPFKSHDPRNTSPS